MKASRTRLTDGLRIRDEGSAILDSFEQQLPPRRGLDAQRNGKGLPQAPVYRHRFGPTLLLNVATHQSLIEFLCQVVCFYSLLVEQRSYFQIARLFVAFADASHITEELATQPLAQGMRAR